ncbi:MAG TPA: hypothetical protein PLR20_03790 [Syntrophales bacterium]|jgi:hypothetical protein|nr:hypothetical protein [Syntrophales bacterium]HPI57796.1 hypothetical protein [Syntrophales bacterium]HPN25510.1 hypothetical protein [Syntrophales bacterium]HQM28456.1 hypothetical protein [Syntrophales bacterium]
MKILAANVKARNIRMVRDTKMESSIIDNMNKYFRSDSGKPRKNLEHAIISAMYRYFEVPSREKM